MFPSGVRPAVLHLDQVLIGVRDLPKWLRWRRHEGALDTIDIPVTSLRVLDTELRSPLQTPAESRPDLVTFRRDDQGDWHFEGRAVVIEMELPLQEVAVDECIRRHARRFVTAEDAIASIVATAGEPNAHRNIPIELHLVVSAWWVARSDA